MVGHGSWCGPDCFGCKVASINISATVYATRPEKRAVVRQMVSDVETAKDLPAYKRLRKQGFQPKSTFGAAKLEAGATTEFEIAYGQVSKNPGKVAEAVRMFEESTGQSPLKPVEALP